MPRDVVDYGNPTDLLLRARAVKNYLDHYKRVRGAWIAPDLRICVGYAILMAYWKLPVPERFEVPHGEKAAREATARFEQILEELPLAKYFCDYARKEFPDRKFGTVREINDHKKVTDLQVLQWLGQIIGGLSSAVEDDLLALA